MFEAVFGFVAEGGQHRESDNTAADSAHGYSSPVVKSSLDPCTPSDANKTAASNVSTLLGLLPIGQTEAPTLVVSKVHSKRQDEASTTLPPRLPAPNNLGPVVDFMTKSGSASAQDTSASIPPFTPLSVNLARGNASIVQIAFQYALNYPFVVQYRNARVEIYQYLASGLAYGLNCTSKAIDVTELQPYDTSRTDGFITTVALAYIPYDLVGNLSRLVPDQKSKLYSNPDANVASLMSIVDPTFPVIPHSEQDLGPETATITGMPSPHFYAPPSSFHPPAQESDNGHTSKHLSAGAIAGIVVGVVIPLAVLATAFSLWLVRKKRRAAALANADRGLQPETRSEKNGS